jgi:hypothetical protein
MRCELDLLVPPLGRSEMARDDAGPMHAPEIAEHECVACLRLVRGAIGQTQVPRGELIP